MKTYILPFKLKTQKGKLTRVIFNENEHENSFMNFKKEIRNLYNGIENVQISFNDMLSQVINANISENHFIATLENLEIKFINMDKIPMYRSVENIANQLK